MDIKKELGRVPSHVRGHMEADVEYATRIAVEAYRSRPEHAQRSIAILMAALHGLISVMNDDTQKKALPIAIKAAALLSRMVTERAHARLSAS